MSLSRLESVLDAHLGGSEFKVLVINVEEYDIEILRFADPSCHRPHVTLIEVMSLSVDTLAANPALRYLQDGRYVMHS